MLQENAWRKLPKDLLIDEDFSYVESILPKEYAYAPYMFYVAALRKADDNGIFDVEDFVIFARLMRVDDIQIVKEVLNALIRRKVIYREGESTLCGFWHWEHGEGSSKPRPIAERRAIVKQRIEAQSKEKKSLLFSTGPANAQKAPETTVMEAENSTAAGDFLCPENDKNAQIVVKNKMDDKNSQSVGEKNPDRKKEREKESEIKTIQDKERTHTQEGFTSSGLIESPPLVKPEEKEAVANKDFDKMEKVDKQPNDSTCNQEASSLAEMALQNSQDSDEETKALVVSKLTKFFVKNCYGYNERQGSHSVQKLAKKIIELEDTNNPADTLCDILCQEFKRMHDGNGNLQYWKDIPLRPDMMNKPNVWAHLMSYAGRLLQTQKITDEFTQAAEKAKADAQAEQNAVSVELNNEYLKYNIAPDDPNRVAMLLQAKANAQAEKEESEIDIF